jgi:hypothetical protein
LRNAQARKAMYVTTEARHAAAEMMTNTKRMWLPCLVGNGSNGGRFYGGAQ